MACVEIVADGCRLVAAVKQQTFIALSSGEAEFGGVRTGTTESLMFKNLFEWLEFEVVWLARADRLVRGARCVFAPGHRPCASSRRTASLDAASGVALGLEGHRDAWRDQPSRSRYEEAFCT